MNKTFVSVAAAFLLTAGAALADPAEGRWSTQPDDNGNTGIVEITMCGDTLCGTLIESRRGNGEVFRSENVGRQIVWDMEPVGNGEYRNGRVWSPDRDQTYRATMELRGDRLTVSGCFLIICREQTWSRVR